MTTLRERYEGFVCDLDGVVYRGPAPVAYAVEALARPDTAVVYATNNASRPPQAVADHLVRLGLTVDAEHVVTSSQAGARRILARCPVGSSVLAVGGLGVRQALVEVGLVPVTPQELRDARAQDTSASPPLVAVLQGYGADVTADDLAWASYTVAGGTLWVATNTDATLPTDRGVAPGNGMLVAAVQRASGVTPQAAGKPQGDLYDLACDRLGTRAVLGVGDRLDTDILGAMAAGIESLWVLTGVDDLASLVTAPGRPRPTYVAQDLRALDLEVPLVTGEGSTRECLGWVVERDDRDPAHPVVTVRRRDDEPAGAGAGEQDGLVLGLAVLNAGLQLVLAALDAEPTGPDAASTDGAEHTQVLLALTSSIEEQAGLRQKP